MAKYAIIISALDTAGLNIKEKLLALNRFKPAEGSFDGYEIFSSGCARLYTIECDTVFAERIDEKIEADFFIFATRHEASAGIPTLSAHAPGNFGRADFGGDDKKLCPAPALLLKKALKALERHKPEGFTVTMEATHHGPYIEKPAMFVEIGSNEECWRSDAAGRALAEAIAGLICEPSAGEEFVPAAAIGGPHYCTAFNRYMQGPDFAFGHVCPKYNAGELDEAMILQMADKTVPRAKLFFIDWKGIGSESRSGVIGIIEKLGFEYRRA